LQTTFPYSRAVRILYVLDRFPVLSETFVIREVRELARTDDVRVYARRRGDAPEGHAGAVLDAVRFRATRRERAVAIAWTAVRAPVRFARALAWALGQREYERGMLEAFGDACALRPEAVAADRLHAHFAHWPASVAVLASILSGTPCSFTTHAHDLFTADPRALGRKVAASRTAITVSDHTRDALADAAPGHAGRIAVVRNGVDPHTPTPHADQARPLVLTVARLVPKKGVDTLVSARSLSTVDAEWLVLGDGPQRAVLERRAGRAVTFGGGVASEAVAEALGRAAVFALPCRITADGDRDALPVALVEALAAGVPVVSTAVGGIPEVVEHGVSGLLVPPADPEALARAIDRVLTDPGLAETLRAGGLQAARRYDLARCIADLRATLAA
jgi:colanic acid/amylovoran biosynthesis glycosyltransferase